MPWNTTQQQKGAINTHNKLDGSQVNDPKWEKSSQKATDCEVIYISFLQ